jgi:hypothetical protein
MKFKKERKAAKTLAIVIGKFFLNRRCYFKQALFY